MILRNDESKPLPYEEIHIPLDEWGKADIFEENYRMVRIGRRSRVFIHWTSQHWVRVPESGVVLAFTAMLRRKGLFIPRNVDDLLRSFDHLVIEETDQSSRKIMLAGDGKTVYNWATLERLLAEGKKPWEDFSWQEDSRDWKYNYLTRLAGFVYCPPELRLAIDQIYQFLADAIGDEETLFLRLNAIANALHGEQLAKVVIVDFQKARGTGKTLFSMLMRLMFGDLGAQVSIQTLSESDMDKVLREFFLIASCRYLAVSELSRKPANLELMKLLVSADALKNRFLESSVLQFFFQGKLFFDTNRPLMQADESTTDLEYQTFTVRFGRPVLKKDPHLFEKLSTQPVIDTFASNLIDNFFLSSRNPSSYKKTAQMKLLDTTFRIEANSGRFFYDHFCIGGISSSMGRIQNLSSHEVYDLYVISIKLLYHALTRELHLNLRDDGTTKSDHEIFGEIRILDFGEFTRFLNTLVGEPSYMTRNARGYHYQNLYIKDLLVYWYMDPKAHSYYDGILPLLQEIDRINTPQESVQKVSIYESIKAATMHDFFRNLRSKNTLFSTQPESPGTATEKEKSMLEQYVEAVILCEAMEE